MASVLVIDDEESVRTTVSAALVRAGHRALTAPDGREALRRLEDEHVDVVLTDIVMPEVEGIEVIMVLRREHPQIPIVAMSGHGRNSGLYLETARKLGAHSILFKPFTATELVATLDHLLAGQPRSLHNEP